MNNNQLNPSNVPPEVAGLLDLAQKWGIGDDFEREQAIREASKSELLELATCLDNVDSDALFDWLAGPESYNENPTEEYIAFTILTMAIDSAKSILKKLSA
jgi:hypothetical protein